jgi:arylsulfatase A-like enzyme
LELNYDQHDKWFLHVDTFDPHEPWDPPKWYAYMYNEKWKNENAIGPPFSRGRDKIASSLGLSKEDLRAFRARYAGEVTLVDRWVGRLLEKVGDLGLFEDTLIIFTSDHGTYLGEHGWIGKTPVLYDEVAGIPLIVRVADTVGDFRGHCDGLVQPPDLMPTVLDFAGVDIPESVQGSSMLPLIRKEKRAIRQIVVSAQSLLQTSWITVRTKEWSLISVRNNSPRRAVGPLKEKSKSELYNVKKDPEQSRDLYGEEYQVAENLQTKMITFLKSLGTDANLLRDWKSTKQDVKE